MSGSRSRRPEVTMRMREYQVFLRWTCAKDIIDDGTLVEWVDTLEAKMQQPFVQWMPLGQPGAPATWNAMSRLEQLDERMGQGTNQQLRMRLIAAPNPAQIDHFDVQATMHPYTGRYVSACEVRFKQEAFDDQDTVEFWVETLKTWAKEGHALSAHMHQADDDAIQNVSSVGVLKLGYGIEVESVDVASNPGRETSRGEHRYVVNWLSYFGPEMATELRHPEIDVPGVEYEAQGEGFWIRLSESPQNPDDPDIRARQGAVREQLGLQALAKRQQRAFGFWQKK